jgi:hypothetical protein
MIWVLVYRHVPTEEVTRSLHGIHCGIWTPFHEDLVVLLERYSRLPVGDCSFAGLFHLKARLIVLDLRRH